MDFSQFHFENALWLWGIAAIPAVLLLYALFYKGSGYAQTLERFADKHLLPHLLKNRRGEAKSLSKPLLLWSLAWLCGMLAMAGPRWNYTEVQAFKPEKDLVIVLDLSTTMSAQDVKPSRVIQARERIEDLLNASHGITVGLVAYAAVPHMIAPLTDDTQTIRNLLPAIDTSLVTLQGDRLKPALEMASRMLDAEPGNSKSILVISDGNFDEEAGLAKAAGGANIYTMGVGTAEGAPIAADNGGWVKDSDDKMLIAKLRTDKLQALGTYVGSGDTDAGIKTVVARINGALAGQQNAQKNIRIWQERFYIPAFLLALLLLPLFRKGYVFPVVFFLMLSTTHAEASWLDWFLNNDQQGEKAYDQGDYKGAMEKFNAPYQHGVAAYKAGQYDQAAQSFKAASGTQAEYNLGNTQLQQSKPEDAIATYEDVLKKNPDDAHAKHNLELAKKMLEQQKQQQQQNPDQKKNDQQDKQQQSQNSQQQSGQKDQQQNSSQKDPSQANKDQSQQQQENDRQQSGQKQDAKDQQDQSGKEQDKQQAAQEQKSQEQKEQAQKDQAQNGQQQKEQEQKAETQAQKDAQVQQQKDQQQQNGKEAAGQESKPTDDQQQNAAVDTRPRTQQDINADQWLGRIQNDPGSFLKNQFMIEDRNSGQQ